MQIDRLHIQTVFAKLGNAFVNKEFSYPVEVLQPPDPLQECPVTGPVTGESQKPFEELHRSEWRPRRPVHPRQLSFPFVFSLCCSPCFSLCVRCLVFLVRNCVKKKYQMQVDRLHLQTVFAKQEASVMMVVTHPLDSSSVHKFRHAAGWRNWNSTSHNMSWSAWHSSLSHRTKVAWRGKFRDFQLES